MKLFRVMMFLTVMLGLSTGFLPKAGLAHDASVGIHLGIPFPVFEVHHALPLPPPPPPWAFYNHRSYNRDAYDYRPHFRHYRDREYRGKGHGYYKREERRHRNNHHDYYDD